MSKTKRRIIHFLVTLFIVGFGAVGFIVLTASKPQLKRTNPPAPKPPVRVMKIKTGPQAVIIEGEGTVRPVREIQLVPQVSGKVIYISPSLVDGGAFKKGDVLLRIDPVDYQLAVTLARARVKDSESKLKIAEEEAAAAQEEWRLLYKDNRADDTDPPPLVAKEPQLAAAKAKLAGDRADLQKAKLNLARTAIKAPFNGRVSAESVDIGQYVGPTQSLATLFSTEAAQIIVPFEDESLFWFHVPGFTPGDGPGAPVKVRTRFAGRESEWEGKVVRAEGKLDERTRMVDVVIRVEKPYATKPPLAAGLFVTVEIQGRTLENAVVIPRSALRDNDMVWVVDEDSRLTFRKVKVARLSTDTVIVEAGLKDGEMIVLSSIKAVSDGMKVRVLTIKGVETRRDEVAKPAESSQYQVSKTKNNPFFESKRQLKQRPQPLFVKKKILHQSTNTPRKITPYEQTIFLTSADKKIGQEIFSSEPKTHELPPQKLRVLLDNSKWSQASKLKHGTFEVSNPSDKKKYIVEKANSENLSKQPWLGDKSIEGKTSPVEAKSNVSAAINTMKEKSGDFEASSLFPYSIQLSSCRKMESVRKVIFDHRKLGLDPYFVKVDLGDSGIWWRIFAGYYKTQKEALRVKKEFSLSNSRVLKTTYTNLIDVFSSESEATVIERRLEDLGYTPYVVPAHRNSFRLVVGAFITKKGAEKQKSELQNKGIQNRVVQR